MLLASLETFDIPGMLLLAQSDDWDGYVRLIVIGLAIVGGILNWVVGKYKEWMGDKDAMSQDNTSDGDIVYDVTLDEDDDYVLKPRRTATPTPSRPAPPR
ncbi:MAG TPA: hypothetical protein PKN33_11675, partial [Phycisphaerae bacterium]|nr:hypothetical protein [Phycisphaerae bacterium]